MDELFQRLEGRIRALLQKYEGLTQANRNLIRAESQLARENTLLTEKHQVAVGQIENIVSRLKSIEKLL